MKDVCYGMGGCVGFLHSFDKKKKKGKKKEEKEKKKKVTWALPPSFITIIHLPIRICIVTTNSYLARGKWRAGVGWTGL